MKRYSKLEARNTFEVVKEQIKHQDYFFYMRSKVQQEYHPDNIRHFTKECYKYAYQIQDMASLVSSSEISNFLSDIAFKLRNDKSDHITRDELDLIKKFISDSKTEYKKSKYIPLDKVISEE